MLNSLSSFEWAALVNSFPPFNNFHTYLYTSSFFYWHIQTGVYISIIFTSITLCNHNTAEVEITIGGMFLVKRYYVNLGTGLCPAVDCY